MENFQALRDFYARPSFFYYLPLVGFVSYLWKVMQLGRACGLTDSTSPGGQIMSKFTTRFFITLNIFFPIYMAIVIFGVNLSLIIFKRPALKALDANEKFNYQPK